MNGIGIDRSKSIEELTGYYWCAPEFESNVVLKSHAMRRKPLAELTLDDIRTGVMQQIVVSYLVPLALEVVEKDPYAESQAFPAEVTVALLNIPIEFWIAHKDLRNRLQCVYERVEATKDDQDEAWIEVILPVVREAYARFRGELPSEEWLRPLETEREKESWPDASSAARLPDQHEGHPSADTHEQSPPAL